jgi:hypothetical protein
LCLGTLHLHLDALHLDALHLDALRLAMFGGAAQDAGLDHDVGRPADQQQMLDIVAPHQHEAPPRVHGGRLEHAEPRMAAEHAAAERPAAERADQEDDHADQRQQQQERDHELNQPVFDAEIL